jgi:ribosome biogenesis ATPase
MIDPAMCRPGRLDKLLYVDIPKADERCEIAKTLLRKVPLAASVGLTSVEEGVLAIVRSRCEGYSGADIAALVREAGVLALRETLRTLDFSSSELDPRPSVAEESVRVEVTLHHFEAALEKVVPSVSTAQRRKYDSLRSKLAGLPVRGGRSERSGPDGSAGDSITL